MRHPRPTTVDVEALPIRDRPDFPPPVVGVSIKPWGKKSRYYAFGHPSGNNCSWGDARAAIAAAYACPDGVLCHNGKFDVDAIEAEFDLPAPAWDRLHDTMLLLFLDDPHQLELGLKPSAERLLGWAPEEKDVLVDWLIEHQPLKAVGTRLNRGRGGERYAGAFVALAPVNVAGPYACGDVDRTEALFADLWPRVVGKRSMGAPYDRERRLLPLLLAMERRGIQVDLQRLHWDVERFTEVARLVDAWLRKKLKRPDINLDSAPQLAEALVAAGLAYEDDLGTTETGKLQANREAFERAVTNRTVLATLRYRAGLKTALGTFLGSWFAMAQRSGGRIFTTWNQVKKESGDGTAGTRTGRLSATWFMNMPKEFTPLFREHATNDDGPRLPKVPFALPPLPNCRDYVLPFKGHLLIDRDYSQQEPRILAHFDEGEIADKYNADPWIDFHDSAKAELEKRGIFYARKFVKNTNLGLIYGMGVEKLADKNGMTVEAAQDLQGAVLALYPGLTAMRKDMKRRAQLSQPIRTWGGREYFCEAPKMIEGRWRTFDYKLVNVLIQGSAADCTKEAILRLHDRIVELGMTERWLLILNVHDQLTMSVPRADAHRAMAVLREVMEGVEFDVPMLTEGAWSAKSWGSLDTYDKRGKRVHPTRRAA